MLLSFFLLAPQSGDAGRDDARRYAQTLLEEGDRLVNDWARSSWEAALLHYRESLAIHQTLSDEMGEASCCEKIARVHALMVGNETSLSFYQKAFAVYEKAGNLPGKARTAVEIGRLYHALEDGKQGFAYLKRGLEAYQAIDDREGQARTSALLAYQYARDGKREEGWKYYYRSVELLKQVGDEAQWPKSLFHQGAFLERQGEYEEALKKYRAVLRSNDDRHLEARALTNIGSILKDRGQPFEALKDLERAADLFRAMDPYGLAASYVNMGEIYAQFGENFKALDFLNRARALFDRPRNAQASTMFSLGDVYLGSGDHGQALGLFQQALTIFKELGNIKAELTVLTKMGDAYSTSGNGEKALSYHFRALQLARRIGSVDIELKILGSLGRTRLALGHYREALCYFDAFLAHEKSASLLGETAETLHDLSRTYLAMGALVPAEEYAYRALAMFIQIGNQQEEALTYHTLARIKFADQRYMAASLDSERALNIVESLRAKMMGSHLRSAFFDSIYNLYSFQVELLMKLDETIPGGRYAEEALNISERARARTLLEILNEVPLKGRSEEAKVLLQRKEENQKKLNGWIRYRLQLAESANAAFVKTVDWEIEVLLEEYRQLEGQIRADDPLYAALSEPHPLNLREIQQSVIDKDTTLLEYVLGDNNSFLWQVDVDAVKSYRLPRRSLIEAQAREVFGLLTARNQKIKFETPLERKRRVNLADKAYPAAVERLSRTLLDPVAANLSRKRLLIVADGALLFIPFGVLPMPGTRQPLIVAHSLVTAPSASVLPVLRRERERELPAPKSIAVLADPVFSSADPRVGYRLIPRRLRPQSLLDPSGTGIIGLRGVETSFQRLPYTRQEADHILALFPPDQSIAALGFEADHDAALSPELRQYRIIHYATHAIIDGQNPELSGLVMSMVGEDGSPKKGFLSQYEIFNMDLNAELVVLSACQTALGKELRGEGQVGLIQGFMYAGAPRVVASLWKIQDKATAELMTRFYRAMLDGGKNPSDALREAQLSMYQESSWRFPYYWGAFVSQGIWSWPDRTQRPR